MALRSNSGSWPPLTGPRDHTHWTHHTRSDSPGRMVSPIQRPVSGNTQHSQQTVIHAPGGIRTHSPSKRTTQTHPLDRAATGIGSMYVCVCIYIYTHTHTHIKCFGRLYMRSNGYDLPIVLSLCGLHRRNTNNT